MQKLEELISWTRMRFKAKESWSVSFRKGKMVGKRFQVNGEEIPLVSEQGVKSLGRWYESNLSDRHYGVRIQEQVRG